MASGKSGAGGAEPKILAERDRLRAIFDSMEDGVYIVERDHRIGFMNRALQRDMGDGAGRFCHEFFGHDPEDCDHCLGGMSSFGPEIRREWFYAKTGKTFEIIVTPFHSPDGGIGRLHILRDVTERKKLEARLRDYSQNLEAKVARQAETLRRREQLAFLGEIAAGLAHEFRTPLGAIITGVRLLEKGGQEGPDRDLVFKLLKTETARLERKVSEFLTYARPQPPQRRRTSFSELLMEVKLILEANESLAGGVNISARARPAGLEWVVDTEQIKEVLLNLGTNALRALGGKGRLTIEAGRKGDSLEVTVTDDGPGIPPEILDDVFKPFFTGHPGGTGLGLALCQRVIEEHGGRLTAFSVPNRDTVFRILLPPPSESS